MDSVVEHIINSAASVSVALGGKGLIGKWLESRRESKEEASESLIVEVRAHGKTKEQVAALSARVAELERHNDEQADQWQQERGLWERDRAALTKRVEVLERFILRTQTMGTLVDDL